ncbi:MAG: hypothetical protein ACWA5A_01765 [Marinibacterium sp.]
MADNFDEFDGRLQRIGDKNRRLLSGYVLHVQNDGLIVAKPRRGRLAALPLRSMLNFIAGLLLFKGVLIAALGPLAYDERVADLRSGGLFEQAGGWIMIADPISRDIGGFIAPVFR